MVVGGGKDVLFLLGYGITFEQPGTWWIMDRFKDASMGVTYVKLPTEISDYRSDILEPCKGIEARMGKHVLVGLSLGGLAGAYLEKAERRIFLSPFWGVSSGLKRKGYNTALRTLRNVKFRVLPRTFSIRDAGYYAVDEDIVGIPGGLSFSTLYQMVQMQSRIPPPKENDIVYRSREDWIICHDAIDGRGIPIVEYEGGHMVHLVRDREVLFDGIVGSVRDALEGE